MLHEAKIQLKNWLVKIGHESKIGKAANTFLTSWGFLLFLFCQQFLPGHFSLSPFLQLGTILLVEFSDIFM